MTNKHWSLFLVVLISVTATTLAIKHLTAQAQDASITTKSAEYWTAEKQAEYSERRLDPSVWAMDMFTQDMDMHDWPTKSALSDFPSPVPKYKNFGGALGWPKMNIPGKHISTVAFSWGKYGVNRQKATDDTHDMISYLNLFILTDDPAPEQNSKSMSSRNYPHVLSTGKQKTSVGEVDWVQTGLADGSNYLIINQRIFDLNFGRTILVAPQKDGSLRFMQIEAPASYASSGSKGFYSSIINKLENDEQVVEFFTNEHTIGD